LPRHEVHKTEEVRMSEGKKEKWEPMKITFAGDAGELLKTGEGKTSPSPQDPGETFQPPGGP
jgi:hypothetical protein